MTRIGIMDSGVGGLTVLDKIRNSHHFVYIGDNARAPYGNRTKEEIILFTSELLAFLKTKEVSVFVSACNSISSQNTDEILRKLEIDRTVYVDMVSATRKHLELPRSSSVLVWATKATIDSGVYQDMLESKGHMATTLISKKLAEYIETNNTSGIDQEIDIALNTILKSDIQYIFFGCTHYPHIEARLKARCLEIGLSAECVDPAVFIDKELEVYIPDADSAIDIYCTKSNSAYDEFALKHASTPVQISEISF